MSDWCEANWNASVTGRAWVGTPYDAGWAASDPSPSTSPRAQAIWREEAALAPVPRWACKIVDHMLSCLPICGHYIFPKPITQVCEAIGAEQRSPFVYGCYTCDPERKRRMLRVVYCLDAWLAQAPMAHVRAETTLQADTAHDWAAIAQRVYDALGSPNEAKRLLVERLCHRLRWWVKTLVWPDDHRDRFLIDWYGGDVRGNAEPWGCYGNSPHGDPYFAERRAPRVVEMAARIRTTLPDGARWLELIESTWLCAPKAFRFVEKLIARIGRLDLDGVLTMSPEAGAMPDDLLDCSDTILDFEACARWYAGFMRELRAWLDGDLDALPVLGAPTPARHWLAHILYQKLELYQVYDNMGNMVGARPAGRGGTGEMMT